MGVHSSDASVPHVVDPPGPGDQLHLGAQRPREPAALGAARHRRGRRGGPHAPADRRRRRMDPREHRLSPDHDPRHRRLPGLSPGGARPRRRRSGDAGERAARLEHLDVLPVRAQSRLHDQPGDRHRSLGHGHRSERPRNRAARPHAAVPAIGGRGGGREPNPRRPGRRRDGDRVGTSSQRQLPDPPPAVRGRDRAAARTVADRRAHRDRGDSARRRHDDRRRSPPGRLRHPRRIHQGLHRAHRARPPASTSALEFPSRRSSTMSAPRSPQAPRQSCPRRPPGSA